MTRVALEVDRVEYDDYCEKLRGATDAEEGGGDGGRGYGGAG